MGTNIQSIIFYFFQRIFVYYHCTENKSVIPKLEEIISSNTRITLFSILSRTQFAEKKPAHFVLAFHFGKHVSSNLYFIIVLNFFHCYWQLWKTSLVLCWVLFISTSIWRKSVYSFFVITHYVGFFSFLLGIRRGLSGYDYRYYPLCWVLFIST